MVTGVTSGDGMPSTYLALVYYQNILCRKGSILNSVSARNYLGHFLHEYITNWEILLEVQIYVLFTRPTKVGGIMVWRVLFVHLCFCLRRPFVHGLFVS